MLLLRKGGQFTDGQIKKYLTESAIYFGLTIGGLLVSYKLKMPIVGLVTIVVALTAFRASFTRWGNWYAGKRGELAVTEALKSLPNDYATLNDLTLPNGHGNIDHLIIAPHGLYVIETKNYAGRVKCQNDNWFVNGRPIKSLSKQAKRNAMSLRDNLAPVFAEHNFVMPFIHSVLVFANHRGRLNLFNPTLPVLKAKELANFIQSRAADAQSNRNRAEPAKINELQRTIVHRLHELLVLPR